MRAGSGGATESAGAGGTAVSASAGGAATAGASGTGNPASSGTTSGAGSSSAGTSGALPPVAMPVETWGGKPLSMVPYATSGTRLTAVGYADEGAVFFATMRDTQLEQLPKIDTVQLGTAELSPVWFFELLSDGKTKVQVQIHSPDGNWVTPNIRTKSGSVCAVYDDRYKDQCLMKDGQSSLPVTEVKL